MTENGEDVGVRRRRALVCIHSLYKMGKVQRGVREERSLG
jgi:hypothetical protein